VPDVGEQLAIIRELRSRARRQLAGRLDREAAWLSDIRSRPVLASPAAELDRRSEQVLALAERGRRSLASRLDRAAADVAHTRARLIALSPAATLRRGYAIVQRSDSSVVRSARDVSAAEPLLIRLASDQINVTVSD
jgi:exodeoxyribonuclease VII large subunit